MGLFMLVMLQAKDQQVENQDQTQHAQGEKAVTANCN